MSNCAIILPVTVADSFLYYMASVALRTLCASTKQTVLILANNSPDLALREAFRCQCELLGARYEYIEGPFDMARFSNLGTDKTDEPYIAIAGQDCIFYPNFCENMVELWREEPDYFALWPWAFNHYDVGVAFQQTIKYERRIMRHHDPVTLLMLRRDYGYRWDEHVAQKDQDYDFVHYVESRKLKIGLCLNARVDHFFETVWNYIDKSKNFGVPDVANYLAESKQYVQDKWK